ncbi:MAG: LuxR C-terminal-related transcriptional regulator [Synergistaceae bacterium]|nr:LuxR C-terminal-related transcriptional regulator [Synergistaceae bacterium]
MDLMHQMRFDPNVLYHFERRRLNLLLAEAVKCPVVLVCAGTGYGKTCSVSDFVSQHNTPVAWMQLSDRDNVGYRIWENFVHAYAQVNENLAEDFREFGFPDTADKHNQLYRMYDHGLSKRQYTLVLDDFHFVKDPTVLGFVERAIYHMPSNRRTMIIISREPPTISLAGLRVRGLVAGIHEDDLNFTENELGQYLSRQGLSVEKQTLREIYQDTNGWAFAVNFIARSLKKSPNYPGYARSAMKKNFFQLMDMEVFDMVSERLRRFLVCLSLIDHLSADLVALLAGEDKGLPAELERQSAYVRFDSYVNAYLIHHLFLDFLRTKQEILTEEEKRRTYQIAAAWCSRNGFKTDALAYYEKIGDYESIVSIFFDLPLQVPQAIAQYAAEIFGRAPAGAFTRVNSLAVTHVRVVMCLGKWREALELMTRYEAELLRLPEGDALRNYTLGGIYYSWAFMRQLMCTIDDRYDFHAYYAKMDECLTLTKKSPSGASKLSSYPVGPWFSLVGSARQGAPQEYIDALACAEEHASRCLNGCMAGADDLARGELKFYQGDVRAAESFIVKGLARARARGQFGLTHRALLYMMRIAVSQGDFAKAEQALKDTEALLGETEYLTRFFTYDVTLGTYYNYVLQPERVPGWVKEKFSLYVHTYFNENSANQVKAQYYYITKNYAPLLAYIEDYKRRESTLYGRVELGAMEACVLFKTKDREAAFSALSEAYETALPNAILMPFICMGKDMRTLAAAALRKPGFGVPRPWLEAVERKSATYAKRHAQLISGYKKAHGVSGEVILSGRESEVLRDMYCGLSRSEIAANLNLSVNTVKLFINSIYDKLNARNVADVIRIAVERKLV